MRPVGPCRALFILGAGVLLVHATSLARTREPGSKTAAGVVSGAFVVSGASVVSFTQAPAPYSFLEPNAVLVNVTESDLNRILTGAVHSFGGPVFEGTRQNPAKGRFDLQYQMDISQPVLKLGSGGEANVTFSIREASVDVGRYERGKGKRVAYCENIGARVDPELPIDVDLDLHFAFEGGDLKILPDRLSIPDAAKRVRLIEPTSCRGSVMPRWFQWWIGKPILKHRLKHVDEILLASLKKSATRMNDGEGFLRNWELGAGSGNDQDRRQDHQDRGQDRRGNLFVTPGRVDTSRGSLFVSLTASSSRSHATSPAPEWTTSLSDRSFMALSQPFLEAIARDAFSKIAALPRTEGGQFAKLAKSDSLYALIPGLRGIEGKKKFYITVKTAGLPEVALRPVGASGVDAERAMIDIHVSGMEVDVRTADPEDRWLGSLTIESGRIGLVPYANPLGGISFEVLENDWQISSKGIEFNEELLAATIQELAFGEVFETRYAPLLRDGLGAGDARLMPKDFRIVGNHLVIVFG